MLIDYKDKQFLAYSVMVNEIDNNRISHAYLIDANGCDYAFDMVMAFVKEILSKKMNIDSKNDLIHRIDDGNYPEIQVISPDGMLIKKKQIVDLQLDFSKIAVEGTRRIYIIKDADKMRSETSNSMLKFLEEPDNDIVAILITNNYNSILPTIVSRCQIIRLNGSKNDYEDQELSQLAINFVQNIEVNGILSIINLQTTLYDNISMKDREKFVIFFDKLIDIYYYMIKKDVNKLSDNLIEIAKSNTNEKLNAKIECLIRTKDAIKNNVNIGLLIDNLILNWRKI